MKTRIANFFFTFTRYPEMNYKSYQQVLDLSSDKKRSTHTHSKPKGAEGSAAPKKRTKTGCLTCRRRKKKCDEDKVDGKCQSCVRNFLDCCWPGEAVAAEPSVELTVKPKPTVKNTGASAYPSPMLSPKSEAVDLGKEIKPLQLLKVTKVKSEKKRLNKAAARFVVTSFDRENMLCQIKN